MNSSVLSRGAAIYLWAVAVLAAMVILADSFVRLETIEKITAVNFRPPGEQVRPGAPETRPEFLVLPESSMDAKWWILHAEDLLSKEGWRVRLTSLDNAPEGREVHWSSGLTAMLALGGRALALKEGDKPTVHHIARFALFLSPFLFGLLFLLLCTLVWKVLGDSACALFAAAFLTTPSIYRTFQLGEMDHHGVVMVFLMALVWCLWAGLLQLANSHKSGKSAPLKRARNWLYASGIFGGAALWISAATAIPVLLGVGIGGLIRTWLLRSESKAVAGSAWTTWATVGCISSIMFYGLEYFPSAMGLRLEVNHPLYGLAWLGAGLLMDWIARGLGQGLWGWKDARAWVGLALVSLPLAFLFIGRERFFWVADPFLLALHREYILEFQSLLSFIRTQPSPWTWLVHQGWTLFPILLGSIGIARGWFPRRQLVHLPVLFLPAIVMQLLTIDQVRWAYAASGLWTLCSVAVVTGIDSENTAARRTVGISAGFVALFALLLSLTPQLVASIHKQKTCLQAPIEEKIGNGLLLRDIAHRLMESSPERVPIVLAGPNSSTELAFHARLRTVGTLYWENMPGLKRAARIFASPDEEHARKLLTEEEITHIVIPSWENFGGPYARLYSIESGTQPHPDGAPFFKQLVEDQIFPQWLRPFAYPIPTSSGIDGTSVRIFAVIPNQSPFEHAFYQALYFWESGKSDAARDWFRRARSIRPDDPRLLPFLQKLNLSSP